jgi:sphingomyelin phosphodiesterase acid-like 3
MGFRIRIHLFLLSLLLAGGVAQAQSTATPALPKALLISDIHFDPFHDPAKVSQLLAAPVSKWQAILAAPDSPTQAKDFAAMKATCKQTGNDTWYALWMSSLAAIEKDAPDVRFVTVSGDLLAHDLPCKWGAIVPTGTPAQYESLVEKTMEFQIRKLEEALPHAAIYVSLGNNDSNCDDYKLDTNTDFLKTIGRVVGQAAGKAWTPAAQAEFATGGYYSVTMAAPMQHTRLIVVNDIFLAPKYQSCANKPDTAPGIAQMQWLTAQLDAARRMHQQVWVMGHIPPGVNPYATAKKGVMKICAPAALPDAGPAMFMPSEILGDTLTAHADVVRLAIFAHTHGDELRLYSEQDKGEADRSIAVKLVPSITPFNGNYPAFTVAQVDPARAVMADYTVFAAADAVGSAWSKEYTFSQAYGHTGFTPDTLRAMIHSFRADTQDASPASQAYLQYYQAGGPPRRVPGLMWEAGVCALDHENAGDFAACACALK